VTGATTAETDADLTVVLLEEQARSRVPKLGPIRYGRMQL
jgi:hypothetical protein